jgi:hypothetical protein
MTADQYLRRLLDGQALSEAEMKALRSLRERIEGQLARFEGSPRFYYAGSYGKDTIIRANYDLDIVMYWPTTCTHSLAALFEAVGRELKKHWKAVNQKNVAWSLPFEGGFHIDIVPGRAIDPAFRYANLYRSTTGSTLQTSIKAHIDAVRKSGRRELIRVLKLWKVRRRVPVKSFVLEILGIEGAKGTSLTDLGPQVSAALAHIRDGIEVRRIIDPANSNNDLAETMTAQEKKATRDAAAAARAARTWDEIFRR